MEAILGIIGFLVCFFVFHITWWKCLLIAFIGIPLLWDFVIGPLFFGGAYGVASLLDKMKERQRKPYPETTWEADYEAREQWEEEKEILEEESRERKYRRKKQD